MTIALVMPTREKKAIELGRNLWRKQVLKKGTIDYKGRSLTFDDAYLSDLAKAYNDQAFDQVAFQLAGPDNEHTLDPERTRGEIKGFIQTADGLDALIETTDAGSEVIRANPKLGVSARIVEGLKHADGRSFRAAIQHVLGTLDPRVTGMGQWQPVNLSSPSIEETIDLSTASYNKKEGVMPNSELTKEQVDKLTALLEDPSKLDDEQKAKLLALLPDPEGAHTAAPPTGEGGTEGDLDKELADFLAALAEPAGVGAGDEGAQLSAADRQAIELANARAKSAQDEATAVRAELDLARFEAEKAEFLRAGIPPAAIDLATPFLIGQHHVIDLAGGTKADAGEVVRGLLKQMAGTIDLSGEQLTPPSTEAVSARDALLAQWQEQHPLPSVTAPAN